ncbi:hypothetical protein [Priestia megaterium]|uniref:hypothetical protein n=1 Tax=Priestia megaterium TaxID=1404 RepID=UPI002E207F97|nr:hypothetical protein [Priestia megaterium]
MKQIDERMQIQKQFANLQKEYFFENILFSYQWWILVATTVILWIIWLLVVDKKG